MLCPIESDTLWAQRLELTKLLCPVGFSRQETWSELAFLPPRGSSQPRSWTWVSCIAGRFFTIWATREAYGDWDWAQIQGVRANSRVKMSRVDGKLPAGDLTVGGYLLTCLTGFLLKASQDLRHQGCRMRNFIRDQNLSAIKGGVETGRFFFFGRRLDREGHGQVKVKV